MADSLGADRWFGIPRSEQQRCAEVIWASPLGPAEIEMGELSGDPLMVALGYFNPPGYSSVGVVNSTRWRSAQVPSTNGHGTATGVARFYAALLEPHRLLSPDLLAEATSVQSEGWCPVLGEETTFGLGFKPTFLADRSVPTREASGISAPEVRSVSPTPMPVWRSAT